MRRNSLAGKTPQDVFGLCHQLPTSTHSSKSTRLVISFFTSLVPLVSSLQADKMECQSEGLLHSPYYYQPWGEVLKELLKRMALLLELLVES